MTKFVANLSTIAIAAVAIASAAAPARADAFRSDEVQSVKVDFSDLSLADQQGMNRLHARITYAAGKVCGSEDGTRDLSQVARVHTCMNKAVDGANARVAAILRHGDQRVAMVSGVTSGRIEKGQ